MKPGDLVKPLYPNMPSGRKDPRGFGVLIGRHNFFPVCWNVYWNYDGRASGIGAAYEDSLEVLNESR